MRKTGLFIAFLLILLLTLPAAGAEPSLQIVTVNFPEYDAVRAIGGEDVDVVMLLPPGSESHQFEPTPRDLIKIAQADLFFYNGGESDTWAESILESFGSEQPTSLRMMDCVQVLSEEKSASMYSAEPKEADSHEEEQDEHVWTSVRNMKQIAEELGKCLMELAPENKAAFETRLDAYLKELDVLDAAFAEVVQNGKRDLLVFGDRFPFRYFVEDYGLRYDAAFPGCSEQTEPNVNTVISLMECIVREKIPVVLTIEFSSEKTADILCEETGAVKRTFHSCHNVSTIDLENGVTYLSLMYGNLEVLREALN